MSKNLIVLGPGKTSLGYKNTQAKNFSVLAFQEVFPHCVSHLDVVPDYWTAGDPNSFVKGMEYLLNHKDNKKLNKINILMPSIFTKDLAFYRMYCGTTPLMRIEQGWQRFQKLMQEVALHYKIKEIPVTTTKYIKLFEKEAMLKTITDKDNEYLRFMINKALFGTIEYDSESVIGSKFKWGLENKLTSVVLPVCYYLGAKNVVVFGFDYQGPRFYSDDARHPWNDETQSKDETIDFSLKVLEKWLKWESLHGMKIYSGNQESICLPNKILSFYQEKK